MRVLVTGGAGYIGSVVSRLLLEEGHQVAVLDDLSRGHQWAVPDGVEFHRADLADRAALEPALRGRDAVLHFAALSQVAESVRDPLLYFRANVANTVALLEAMDAAGVPRMVFSSTAAVYGEPEQVPIPETAPTAPTNAYGATKLAVDHALRAVAHLGRMGAVSLRYFNVAGAAHGVGEAHEPETHLIPLVLAAAASGRAVTVNGTDYPTPDGTAVRDYIHVADLARAHTLALGSIEGPGHRVYNLGNGAGFSVRQVVDVARDVTDVDIPVEEGPRREGDPAVLVASSDRARAELGWAPDLDLTAMVSDAWEWFRRRPPEV